MRPINKKYYDEQITRFIDESQRNAELYSAKQFNEASKQLGIILFAAALGLGVTISTLVEHKDHESVSTENRDNDVGLRPQIP